MILPFGINFWKIQNINYPTEACSVGYVASKGMRFRAHGSANGALCDVEREDRAASWNRFRVVRCTLTLSSYYFAAC